jgi:maleylacetate reductase
MHSFVYSALPGKVLFGFGTIDKVADEIRQLGGQRALVLSTPQQTPPAADLAARLGDLSVGAFTEAAMHTPVAVTQRALDVVCLKSPCDHLCRTRGNTDPSDRH